MGPTTGVHSVLMRHGRQGGKLSVAERKQDRTGVEETAVSGRKTATDGVLQAPGTLSE